MNNTQRKVLCGTLILFAWISNTWVGDWSLSMDNNFIVRYLPAQVQSRSLRGGSYMAEQDTYWLCGGIIIPIGLLSGVAIVWTGRRNEADPDRK